jgi:ABC-2 type transport system permease protein
MSDHPAYLRVFLTFARNSLVRDMTFRSNFLIDAFTSLAWMSINLAFYMLIYEYTPRIGIPDPGGADPGWGKYQFYAFIATTVIVNSVVQAFFMPNASEFSELIRTGNLDFALLKPIDTQFLVSLEKIEWSSLSNFVFAAGLLAYSLVSLDYRPTLVQVVLYPIYVLCGITILYSLMIVMSSISVWLGRNQSLYDFWFYITNFSRYPMEIYEGTIGSPLQWLFTYLIPILIVVNVPARLLAKPLEAQHWPLAGYALLATAGSFWCSRRLFQLALASYRSASS